LNRPLRLTSIVSTFLPLIVPISPNAQAPILSGLIQLYLEFERILVEHRLQVVGQFV